jgi:hypothetical protein
MSGQQKRYPVIIDPEFESLIPPLSPEESAQLEANIRKHGLQSQLLVWFADDVSNDAVLLDGHHRLKILKKLFNDDALIFGREHDTRYNFYRERDGIYEAVRLKSREDAKLWILEHQVGRRNLSDDQRAVIWDEIREQRSKAVRAAQLAAARESAVSVKTSETDPAPSKVTSIDSVRKLDTRAAVAKEAKLPERKLRAAQQIKKASPALAAKVRAGEMTLKQAKKIAKPQPKAKKPKKDLDEAGRYRKLHSFVGNLYQEIATPAERFAEIKKHAQQIIEDVC